MAKVSGETSSYIMRQMPYARGLQYRTVYWLMQRRAVERAGTPISGPLDRRLD